MIIKLSAYAYKVNRQLTFGSWLNAYIARRRGSEPGTFRNSWRGVVYCVKTRN